MQIFLSKTNKTLFFSLFYAGLLWVLFLPALSVSPKVKASGDELLAIKRRILEIINQQRRSMGLRTVALDEFASQVADRHCQEMLSAGYTSHWNQKGYKPYMRYSFAGGDDAVMENVASQWRTGGFDLAAVARTVEVLHMGMFNEQPPQDGHRQNILQPQHTHVGIGIAFDRNGVRFAQEFIARYVELAPLPRRVKAGEKITIKGNLLYDKTDMAGIDIFYEPLPEPLTVEQLNRTGVYGLPKERRVMRPLLAAGYRYGDGTEGEINYDIGTGTFTTKLDFPANRPGIYTILVWVAFENRKFPASNISIEVY